MLITEKEVVLQEGLAIHWEAIKNLKVLNEKLLFAMKEGVTVEISGLSSRRIDEIFLAYYKYLNLAPAQSAPH